MIAKKQNKVELGKAQIIDDKVHYFGQEHGDYIFTFKDEKFHNYNHFVVQPSHLRFIKKDMTAIDEIIEHWFGSENDAAREHIIKKAKIWRGRNADEINAEKV